LVYVLILQVGILLWEIRNSQHIYQVGNLKYFPVKWLLKFLTVTKCLLDQSWNCLFNTFTNDISAIEKVKCSAAWYALNDYSWRNSVSALHNSLSWPPCSTKDHIDITSTSTRGRLKRFLDHYMPDLPILLLTFNYQIMEQSSKKFNIIMIFHWLSCICVSCSVDFLHSNK